jgi:HAD superfamily hydrolase (TIGR01509 family)
MLKALIFDVDGTLADTEAAHLRAFNQAFAQEGLDWHWTLPRYTELLAVSGGKERMLHHWREVNPDLKELDGGALQATIDRLHEVKTAFYEDAINQGLVVFRPGVLALIEVARVAGLPLAIATTTSPANVAALLRSALGTAWRSHFAAVGDAGNAPIKKPHPQVYLKVLADLGLSARDGVALEDSANGLQAAMAAGLPTVITPNSFTAAHDFAGAMRVVPDLSLVKLADLRGWHAAFHAESSP